MIFRFCAFFVICIALVNGRPIRASGSSTVFPFMKSVAEHFVKEYSFEAPIIESVGTGGGVKLFCAPYSVNSPSILMASRPIKTSEVETCHKNGVQFMQFVIGYDAIVLVISEKDEVALTKENVFSALTPKIWQQDKFIDNKVVTWESVKDSKHKGLILFYGPPTSSGTRDAFIDLIMKEEANKNSRIIALKSKNKTLYNNITKNLRTDVWNSMGENDAITVKRVLENKNAIGVLGYNYFKENRRIVRAIRINGVLPEEENLYSKKYPLMRKLFLYVNIESVKYIPGLYQFMDTFFSENAIERGGYLLDLGLIPLNNKGILANKNEVERMKKW